MKIVLPIEFTCLICNSSYKIVWYVLQSRNNTCEEIIFPNHADSILNCA